MQAPASSLLSLLSSTPSQPSLDGSWAEGVMPKGGLNERFLNEFNRLRDTASSEHKEQTLPLALPETLSSPLLSSELLPQDLTSLNAEELSTLLAQISLGQRTIPYTPMSEMTDKPLMEETLESEAGIDVMVQTLTAGSEQGSDESVLLNEATTVDVIAPVATEITQDEDAVLLAQAEQETAVNPMATVLESKAEPVVAQPLVTTGRQGQTDDKRTPASTMNLQNLGSVQQEGEEFFKPQETFEKLTPAVTTAVNIEKVEGALTQSQSAPNVNSVAFSTSGSLLNQAFAPQTLATQTAQSSEFSRQLETQMQAEQEFSQDQQQWGNALSNRIMTMISEDVQQARIHLDPPELGTLEIKLQIHQQQATIQVHAQHTHVRDALETHAFRLRESLSEQGIALKDFDVSSGQQFSQQQQEQQESLASSAGQGGLAGDYPAGDEGDENDAIPSSSVVKRSINLLDTYA